MNLSLFLFIIIALSSGLILGEIFQKIFDIENNISNIFLFFLFLTSSILFIAFSYYLKYLRETKFKNKDTISSYLILSIISGFILSPFITLLYELNNIENLTKYISILLTTLIIISLFVYTVNKYEFMNNFFSILSIISVLIGILLFFIIIITPIDYAIFNVKLINVFWNDIILVIFIFSLTYFYEKLIKSKNKPKLAISIGFVMFFEIAMFISDLLMWMVKTIFLSMIKSIVNGKDKKK